MLPPRWNQDQMAYVLRYNRVSDGQTKRLLLKAIPHDGALFVSVLETPGDKSAETSLKANQFLSKDYREFDR